MKRYNYPGVTFLAIGISMLIASNVFAAETPAAATAYANAKTAAKTAQREMDSVSGIFGFSFGTNTKPSKAIQATLAYKISLANSSAKTASMSAGNSLANSKAQTIAGMDSAKAATSYLTLAGVICPPNTSCTPEATAASQSATQTATAFTAAAQAASTWAAKTMHEAKIYKSEVLAYTAAAKAGKISLSAFLKALSKADLLAAQQDGGIQVGSSAFDAAATAVTSFDASYASYQQAPVSP